jgi:chromosome segregation protein
VRLRRLELAGFKTFADRTRLELSPAITAIVGPNGSGKSNIFDAIRWALGEGSLRALRGVRNEDVIFAGSEKRRPLAMAEVTLTLDTEGGALALPPSGDQAAEAASPLAFAEVTVTRRALRAAESQYEVNGLPCRLRDIQTMFLGTGLGGHSYALITQGEVDHTLEATPEERRMILEEAAGLARYKRRRRDAERRMATAEQLLLRVADILGEQEARVAQLASQAEAARQYQAHTQELRALELALRLDEVRRLTRTQKRVRDQLEQIAVRRREVEQALRALADERAALDRRTAEAGREREDAQRALMNLTERRTGEEATVRLIEERRRGTEAQQDRLARARERYRAEETALREERAALDEADARLRVERERIEAAAADAGTRLLQVEADVARDEERVEQGRQEARALASDRAHVRGELAAAEARLAGCRDRLAALGEREHRLQGRREAILGRRRALGDDLARIIADLEARRRAAAALRGEQERRAGDRDEVLADLRRLELQREQVRSRLGYLEEAHAQYRGYEAGARALLLARQADPARFGALRGTVAESLRVPRDLRPAIEAALGPFLSALIVDSTEDARALRNTLHGRGAGKIAFLPLSLMRARESRPLPAGGSFDAGVRGRATDLVQAAADRVEIVRALLADVWVTEDLDAALRLRAAGYDGWIVTLHGEGISPEGILTARGAPARASQDAGAWEGRRPAPDGDGEWVGDGPLGRAEEIAEARASLARMEEETHRHAQRGEEASARLRETEAAIAEAEAGIAEQRGARADAERRLTLLDAEIARLVEEIEGCATERRTVEDEAAALERFRQATEARAAATEARIEEIDAETQSLSVRLRDQTATLREARDRIADLRVSLTQLDGQRVSLEARLREVDRGLGQVAARCDELDAEAARLEAERAALAAEDESARARCRALVAEAALLEQTLAGLDVERSQVAARRSEIEAQHLDTASRADALAEDAHRIELRLAQTDAEIGSARRRIEEEFGRPFEQASAQGPDPVDRDETLGRIEALRGLVAALGPINLIAIEEHRLASERMEALREQYEDVQGCLASLRALIAQLEGVIRTRFEETFRAVDAEFSALFTRLFGGGRAGLDLVAVEGSDEPGIDIAVQPPGKNLRSLGALSGGERVMVALALIFAMLRVRPSPFCVFDEIEAALDETNTRTVAEVLREIAEHTQIIIITHNKATMEACDVMFGVTMEEPGVSHMVSVRLTDRDRLREGQPVG